MTKGILAGIVAFILMWGGWHLVIDHALFHRALRPAPVSEAAK